ncbi:hypothetical protein BBK14_22740 [Parafrankia soli]|uniref:Tetratrico peptide repeat group 5 domain-containing protein n=1 Tax=Parafrankia soli TaxID=2599596 RepID=A0A1S1PQW2_9ACTN|nr:hypothetical protein BBK14_22740 [Parafrankia soli]
MPDEAKAELLDRDIRRDLRSVPAPLAETIARHLVATALLVDTDPVQALAHARAAAARLPRMAAVREAVGVAAYHAGEFASALLELRAARRIDGSSHNLPLMADAERGLGRPERAIDYLSDPGVAALDAAGRAELLIVVSGARRDMGQPEAAAVLLRDEVTARTEPKPWTPRLWYAYAEALLAAGRTMEALRWFTATAGIDEDTTDAAERVYELTIDDETDDETEIDNEDGGAEDDGPESDRLEDELLGDERLEDDGPAAGTHDGAAVDEPDPDGLIASGTGAAVDAVADDAALADADADADGAGDADAEAEAADHGDTGGASDAGAAVDVTVDGEPAAPVEQPAPAEPAAAVEPIEVGFSAAEDTSAVPAAEVTADTPPIPEIIFSDAPGGADQAGAHRTSED